MRQSKALIEARKILGPSGHVRRLRVSGACQVGVFGSEGFQERGWGATWEEALAAARPKPKLQGAIAAVKPKRRLREVLNPVKRFMTIARMLSL